MKSVLLKLPPEVHTRVKDAARAHKRSMQSVLVALVESWLAAGAPDPVAFPEGKPENRVEQAPQGAIDKGARTAIEALTRTLRDIQQIALTTNKATEPEDQWSQKVISDLKGIEYHPKTTEPDQIRGLQTQRESQPDQLDPN